MFLKKLEVQGFKSFADRTDFSFGDGITAFVGPNGCGKSNVVDAVKWIMGEQSAKSLRGRDMLDVIFNGTASRKSLGYAEASMTFENNRGLLPLEYQEVCITRRLFRSGESEYLINQQPCRLRDIRDLLMDTGLGADSYSVIEQGRVDMLLQANANERRAVFEEAAGISKYKAKKKSALAKLDRVEQDILRLNDIVAEVEKRLRSVKYQAGKARRYKEYTERLRDLRIALSVRDFRALRESGRALTQQIHERADEVEAVRTGIDEIEALVATLDEQTVVMEQALREAQSDASKLAGRVENAHAQIAIHCDRVRECNRNEDRLIVEIRDVAQRMDQTQSQLTEAVQEAETLEVTVAEHAAKTQDKSGDIERLEETCARIAAEIEEKKAITIQILHEVSKCRNQMSGLATERLTLDRRTIRLAGREDEIDARLGELSGERGRLESEKAGLTASMDAHRELFEAHRREQEDTEAQMGRLDSELSQLRQARSRKESRRELLQDLQTSAEGVSQGAKAVLEEATREGGALRGVRGMVAELVEVARDFAPAVEAALGDDAQSIVTQSSEAALDTVRFLSASQRGRVACLAMDRARAKRVANIGVLQYEGVVGRGADLVGVADDLRPVAECLLGDVVVVRDLAAALSFANNGGRECRLVTLAGETIEPDGHIRGGKEQGPGGLISRKSELEALQVELAQIARSLEETEWKLRQRKQRHQRLGAEIEALRAEIDDENIQRLGKESAIQQCDREATSLRDERGVVQSEIKESQDLLAEVDRKEGELRGLVQTAETRRHSVEREVEALTRTHRERGAEKERLQTELTELKVLLAQARQKHEGVRARVRALRSGLEERQEQLRGCHDKLWDVRVQRAEAAWATTEAEDLIRDLTDEREAAERRAAEAERRRDEMRAQLSQKQAEAKAQRSEIERIESELQGLRLKENESRLKIENLAQRIAEDYELSLSDVEAQTPDEQEGETNWQEVEEQIADLRRKIDRMGPVNVEAIQEQDELEIRLTHYQKQMEDVLGAQKRFQEAIRKINQTSRELFQKTFDEIRENFQEIFRKLFGGGRADIILEEGVDILDAGIDIVARPPGKEPRSISLLSGGEKTMTTVALLFAIFRSRPSPFCILDEVDAALDESNITRFVRMVSEFVDESQFIIITHSKRTMSAADVLYGITMQDSGVSKKIAVKFEELEKQVA